MFNQVVNNNKIEVFMLRLRCACSPSARPYLPASPALTHSDLHKYNLRNKCKKAVFLNVGGEALELTGSKCHFYHFRFNANAPIRVKTLVAAKKRRARLVAKSIP
ncbi:MULTISPECIES: hypothetical protein [Pseudomonas]|uniref:hypothetical protein n=1 Tax=Pseudomonas TaxID=286 RepID=UPI000D036AAA|nr:MULTISPECIES: hypothetical protein [Pseudomonas]PRW85668.1 hypothetical protein C7A11_22590 [Pseudomonas simiae]CAH0144556.1 hypothetical protein SRABI08_00548 [Pseudomonas carnis]CAH0154542.1 hypothetical protein SRABI111_00791 [Pseudomonas carnis]CAH0214289.1 hypothetical protein SRABI64_02058 [Pseudomonas carnis]CAH0227237.1 hypothetical protein SRABI110_02639 [Pseudomonas carnis]